MVIVECVASVETLIREAAEFQKTASFSALHARFPEGTPAQHVYDTLEAACAQLAPWTEAIYSVVLAKKETDLPGDGFFDIFRIHREAEYTDIGGKGTTLSLSPDQKKQMVALERSRVYAHALR
jgi:hypothetical protein